VKTARALKKRHLAVRRCGQPKKRTQDTGGSRKKLAAARRAGVARCKGPTVEQRRQKKNGPKTLLYKEHGRDGRSGRDVGRNRIATVA
jgi:hypothetical protein